MNSRALVVASVLGTVLQLAMVIAGHSNPSIAALFAVGGMGISLIAGLLYALFAKGGRASSLAAGGAIAGGVCALIGIAVSCALGDVVPLILLVGTASSAVTGAIGGLIGKLFVRGAVVAALALAVGGAPRHASAQPATVAAHVATSTTTVKDFAWLVGRWEGKMATMAGAADVTFAPPSAGLMTGMMRLVDGDKVLVVELISLVDAPNGPELRFRHFSSALEAYETSFKQNMRFRTHLATDDVFENAVPFEKGVMSTQPRVTTYHRVDADTFVGHSDIVNDDGKPGVVEVTYRRVK